MINDVLSIKAATIERCGSHAREAFARTPNTFAADQPALDAAILSSLRACQATLDMGQHLIHRERLGAPQRACGVFTQLTKAGWIDAALAGSLKRMVDFRDIALHDDHGGYHREASGRVSGLQSGGVAEGCGAGWRLSMVHSFSAGLVTAFNRAQQIGDLQLHPGSAYKSAPFSVDLARA